MEGKLGQMSKKLFAWFATVARGNVEEAKEKNNQNVVMNELVTYPWLSAPFPQREG